MAVMPIVRKRIATSSSIAVYLDGATTRPTGFSGPIGRLLSNCEKLAVVEFVAIQTNLPEESSTDSSTDLLGNVRKVYQDGIQEKRLMPDS